MVQIPKLDLSHQSLSLVPGAIQNFKHLVELDLSFNQIERLPEMILGLADLRILSLAHNRLWNLDDILQLSILPNLAQLDLRANCLPFNEQRIYMIQALLTKPLSMFPDKFLKDITPPGGAGDETISVPSTPAAILSSAARPMTAPATGKRFFESSGLSSAPAAAGTLPATQSDTAAAITATGETKGRAKRFHRDVHVLSSQAPGKLSYYGVLPGDRPSAVAKTLSTKLGTPVFYR